ncbi:MAG: hypothetical protein MUE54_09120 [Anaerolineae bacterium]|jgi:hypothetical protein|nr:hypothetical protein [Anaerolineae bacterium]
MGDATSLQETLRFTDADLLANREGHLSDLQQYTLKTRKTRLMIIGILIFFGLAFIATLFIFLGSNPANSGILTFIGIGLTICNALIIGVLFRQWLKLNADIAAERVDKVQGKLERVLKPVNRRIITYIIRVQDTETVVSKEVFTAFTHEQPYILYRTPYTGILLSAERGK